MLPVTRAFSNIPGNSSELEIQLGHGAKSDMCPGKIEMMKSPKRLDLQGIRALAITSVLAFHFFPEYVPNGYLGVDQFFVLSGFLMCMLLKRAQHETVFSLITQFYSKRLKRILPLYLLVIAISMIALYTVFPDSAIETNRESAISALLFVSNRPKTDIEDYFEKLSVVIDIFTHTWSLSVEIQFYGLLPLMFIMGNQLPSNCQRICYVFYAFISYLLFHFSPPTIAFNSVFARVWQFLVGILVYLKTNSKTDFPEDHAQYELLAEQNVEKEPIPEPRSNGLLPNAILICLITIIMCPSTLPADYIRPLVTVSTGLLMLISEKNSLLSSPKLTYLGDISYSLYLIHWPVYAYWKLTANEDKSELCLALICSLILATICYETFEKWYLKLSLTGTAVLVIFLILLNTALLLTNKDQIQELFLDTLNVTSLGNGTETMTLDDAERMNAKWDRDDIPNLFSATCDYENPNAPFGWCRHRGLSAKGKYKMAIFGNSWTANHATLFNEECGKKARSILQGSHSTCEPLFPTIGYRTCKSKFEDFEERIGAEQFDYAFLISRFFSIGDNATGTENDVIYETMRNQTRKFLASIKYKLFILDAIPPVFIGRVTGIVPMLKNNKSPKEIDKELVNLEHFNKARERHAKLAKEFKERVVLVDYKNEFYNNSTNTYRYFDERGFSYISDGNHLTSLGLEKVRHVWTELCEKL